MYWLNLALARAQRGDTGLVPDLDRGSAVMAPRLLPPPLLLLLLVVVTPNDDMTCLRSPTYGWWCGTMLSPVGEARGPDQTKPLTYPGCTRQKGLIVLPET